MDSRWHRVTSKLQASDATLERRRLAAEFSTEALPTVMLMMNDDMMTMVQFQIANDGASRCEGMEFDTRRVHSMHCRVGTLQMEEDAIGSIAEPLQRLCVLCK